MSHTASLKVCLPQNICFMNAKMNNKRIGKKP